MRFNGQPVEVYCPAVSWHIGANCCYQQGPKGVNGATETLTHLNDGATDLLTLPFHQNHLEKKKSNAKV